MNTDCVVFGAVSSGKSTFINALLQSNVCVTGDGITTREKKEYPLGILNIIDLPGINENGDRFVNEYRYEFINAFAIFCIFDKTSAGTIRKYYDDVMELRRNKSRIYFILNKIDDIDNIDEVVRDIRKTVGNQPIFTISARLAHSVYQYRDGFVDNQNIRFLQQYSMTRELNDEDIENAYKDSEFDDVKVKIENLSTIIDIDFKFELIKIIEKNNIIPNEILFKTLEDYAENQNAKKKKIKIISALTGGLIGAGIITTIAIGSLVLLIPTGGASGVAGGAAITSGLVALGPGGMLGGVATASAITAGAAGVGVAGGASAGYAGASGGSSFFGKTKLNFENIQTINITPDDEKIIKQVYEKEYEKEMKKINRFLPDTFRREEAGWFGSTKYESINTGDKIYINNTYVLFNDNYYLINMSYSVETIYNQDNQDKQIKVNKINGITRFILDKKIKE